MSNYPNLVIPSRREELRSSVIFQHEPYRYANFPIHMWFEIRMLLRSEQEAMTSRCRIGFSSDLIPARRRVHILLRQTDKQTHIRITIYIIAV